MAFYVTNRIFFRKVDKCLQQKLNSSNFDQVITKQQPMKTLMITLILILSSISLIKANHEIPVKLEDDKVQVICNTSTGNATIIWNDSRIEFIEIIASNGQFMPIIPVSDAKSLHMNDLINGNYTLIFKSSTETLYTKVIEVNR